MANKATLNAQLREEHGKSAARRLRADGRIPAVLYGHGEATRALSLDARELENLFAHISVESTLITLKIDGEKKSGGELRALVREVQRHPVKGKPEHVDFYQIHAGERITVHVPIRVVGTSAGVRAGGLLTSNMDAVTIRVLPEQIPEAIEVDISALEIGDSVHVRDLKVPDGVVIEDDQDATILAVGYAQAGTTGETAAVPAEPAIAEPEVIRRRPEKEE